LNVQSNPNEEPGSIEPQRPQGSNRLCPSARCEEGAILLGIVGENGVVGYVTPRVIVNSDFVRLAHIGRAPEKRFRFSQPCIESGCLHWTGSRCGVIDHALKAAQEANATEWLAEKLPQCSIRPSCRWFSQVGPKACAVCPLVITDLITDGESKEGIE
jgi:hypothetical protein